MNDFTDLHETDLFRIIAEHPCYETRRAASRELTRRMGLPDLQVVASGV